MQKKIVSAQTLPLDQLIALIDRRAPYADSREKLLAAFKSHSHRTSAELGRVESDIVAVTAKLDELSQLQSAAKQNLRLDKCQAEKQRLIELIRDKKVELAQAKSRYAALEQEVKVLQEKLLPDRRLWRELVSKRDGLRMEFVPKQHVELSLPGKLETLIEDKFQVVECKDNPFDPKGLDSISDSETWEAVSPTYREISVEFTPERRQIDLKNFAAQLLVIAQALRTPLLWVSGCSKETPTEIDSPRDFALAIKSRLAAIGINDGYKLPVDIDATSGIYSDLIKLMGVVRQRLEIYSAMEQIDPITKKTESDETRLLLLQAQCKELAQAVASLNEETRSLDKQLIERTAGINTILDTSKKMAAKQELYRNTLQSRLDGLVAEKESLLQSSDSPEAISFWEGVNFDRLGPNLFFHPPAIIANLVAARPELEFGESDLRFNAQEMEELAMVSPEFLPEGRPVIILSFQFDAHRSNTLWQGCNPDEVATLDSFRSDSANMSIHKLVSKSLIVMHPTEQDLTRFPFPHWVIVKADEVPKIRSYSIKNGRDTQVLASKGDVSLVAIVPFDFYEFFRCGLRMIGYVGLKSVGVLILLVFLEALYNQISRRL